MITARPIFNPYGRLVAFVDGRGTDSISASQVAETRAAPGTACHAAPRPGAATAFNLDACFEMVDVVELGEGRA